MQYGDGSEATRTRTSTGTADSDAGDAAPAPRHPSSTPSGSERLPAPLQYRDPGRYEIVAEHGRGGLGRVFRARDKELGRDVAVKELLSRGSTTELRFFREALITARLEHPGIVPVHEAGRWPDGTPFYAMKLVAGRPLKALIDECKTLEDRLALLPHVIAVADAIAYAHDRKIIHRDLKPSNIIVGDFGETVVIDWGLAKDISDQSPADDPVEDGPYRTAAAAGASDGVTVAGSVLGTPAYMSPEQARGDVVDQRTDVYAIGAILHELCTGHAPQSITAARKRITGVLPDLAVILNRSTDELNARYPNAGELAHDLRAFDAGKQIRSRQYSVWSLMGLWGRRNRAVALTLALAAAVGTILGTCSVSEIIDQRNRATSALSLAKRARESSDESARVARLERDRAKLALARSLMSKDPTEAASLLGAVKPFELPAAILLSRATASGVAHDRWKLGPRAIRRMEFDAANRTVAVALDDGTAHVLSLSNGSDVVVANDVLEPEFIASIRNEWVYATRSRSGIAVRATSSSQTVASLSGEAVPPTDIVPVRDGSYLLTQDGRLVFAPANGDAVTTVDVSIKGVAGIDEDAIIVCSGSGSLLRITRGSRTQTIGSCVNQGDFAFLVATSTDYAVATGGSTIDVHRHGHLERVRMSLGNNSDIDLSETGLLTAVDSDGRAFYQSGPRQPWVSGGRTHVQASVTSAAGTFAAWGFSDGSVRVIDTRTGETWTFIGHDGVVVEVAIALDDRMVISAGGTEVRSWRLTSSPERDIVRLGCQSMNLLGAPGSLHVLADCQDGNVFVLQPQHPPNRVHRHSALAFGIAWWGNEACSGGWDGRIICTDITTNRTRVVAAYGPRIRWLTASADTLYYSVADGSVWSISKGATSPTQLFEHTSEFPRIVLDSAGSKLAAGAEDGTVVLFDTRSGETLRSLGGHDGRVTQLRWEEGRLVTSSVDGSLRTWSADMQSTHIRRSSEPIAQFTRSELGWFVLQNQKQIVPLNATIADGPLPLADSTTNLTGTSDGRFVAWLSGDTISVLDSRAAAVTAWPLAATPEKPCISFGEGTLLHYCRATGEIATVDIATLPFVHFEITVPTTKRSPP